MMLKLNVQTFIAQISLLTRELVFVYLHAIKLCNSSGKVFQISLQIILYLTEKNRILYQMFAAQLT